MPFTPTHIIAIVPIAKFARRLPISALAIGSMIPDLPMFFPAISSYHASHSFPGLFLYCLPVGLIAFLFFQFAVKEACIALLPLFAQQRVQHLKQRHIPVTSGALFFVVLAIVIGSATHVFWDSFTHKDGWATVHLSALNQTIDLAGYTLLGYKLLQYGSTLLFLPLLLLLACRWLRRQPPDTGYCSPLSQTSQQLALAVILLTPVVAAVTLSILSEQSAYILLGKTIRLSGSVWLGSLFIYSVFFRFKAKDSA